ncbi:MAG TPA: hypothetical protein VFC93_18155 [Chloroflexota bacterium]|nr:hypothetical protein [Chloroflexota bacterium]
MIATVMNPIPSAAAATDMFLIEDAPSRRAATGAADWRAAAIAEYEQSREAGAETRRAALVERLRELTGRVVPPERVIVQEGRRALAWVDGVQFRLEGTELTIARGCVHCGLGEMTSPPVRTRADLGYALIGWEPRCTQCPAEDPPEW